MTVRRTMTEVKRVYCNQCGTNNSANSKYCKECGAKFEEGYRSLMRAVHEPEEAEDTATQERLTKLLDMAFWHNDAGNLDAAVLACEAALAIRDSCTTAHSLLGSLYEKKGDDAKAIRHFEAVLALNPESEADSLKLDQLRRGVRVKASAPPAAYKWLPPALAGLSRVGLKERLDALRESDRRVGPIKPVPALAGGIAALLVLSLGFALVKPAAQRSAVRDRSPRLSGAVTTRVGDSAFGGAGGPAGSSNAVVTPHATVAPPIILKPSPGGAKIAATAPDPFAVTTAVPDESPAAPPMTSRARVAAHPARGGSDSPGALPPLGLHAVPVESSLAPAPIALPAVTASVASVPQHTVVVSRLGDGPPSSDVAQLSMPQYQTPQIAPQIRITVNNPTQSAAPKRRAGGVAGDASSGEDAAAYQQSALALQQQGDYHNAKAAYAKAIKAFQAQIAAGRDTDTATRGLQASQIGLEICQQSKS